MAAWKFLLGCLALAAATAVMVLVVPSPDGTSAAASSGARPVPAAGLAAQAPRHAVGSAAALNAGTYPIYSREKFAISPSVSVSDSGRAAVAWLAGTPPEVSAGERPEPDPEASGRPRASAAGLEIFASVGTLPHRLGPAQRLSLPAGDVGAAPHVAVSREGTADVVWQQGSTGSSGTWLVSTARDSQFSRPRALGIPDRANLVSLTSAGGGPVIAAWLASVSGGQVALRYARLTPSGRIGSAITVLRTAAAVQNVGVAINNAGAVAMSWLTRASSITSQPGRVAASVCGADGRCGPVQTLAFTTTAADMTVTLSAAETATVVVTGSTVATTANDDLQAAVSRAGQRFHIEQPLDTSAINPVAIGVGAASALVAFSSAPRALSVTQLAAGSDNFGAPATVDSNVVSEPAVAGDAEGNDAVAWLDAPIGEVTPTSYSIHLMLTAGGRHFTPQLVTPGSEHVGAGPPALGIDDAGDALIVWDTFGASQNRGVLATLVRPD